MPLLYYRGRKWTSRFVVLRWLEGVSILLFLLVSTDIMTHMVRVHDNQARILDYARKQGVIRPRDLKDMGIHREYLRRLRREGVLNQVSRGLYELADAEPSEHQTLIEVCKRVPSGVICLLSALRFHGIGTQLPHEVWLAIPAKSKKPRIGSPALQVVYVSQQMHSLGVEDKKVPNGRVRVYGIAKTVADCFRFRNKIGMDVAIESLRDVIQHRKAKVTDLSAMARKCRIFNVMRPYLEAML